MRVLIVNTYDIKGGAARAAYRLHRALLQQGVDSYMLVQSKMSCDSSVIGPSSKLKQGVNALRPTIDRIPLSLYKKRKNEIFSPAKTAFSGILKKIEEIKPDLIHLHWINGGMISLEELGKIDIPICWSLHDMWAFTGGCHYTGSCEKYVGNCGHCPVLGSEREFDLSKKVWNRKQKLLQSLNKVKFIGLSKWMCKAAQSSKLLQECELIHLPNLIDSKIYKPLNKEYSRTLWNLPVDKKLILFGAVGATSDKRKGFKELSAGLQKIDREDTELVIFGSGAPETNEFNHLKTHYVGHIHDDASMVSLYNAVDVTVVPSLEENLSNVILESLSCGIPVVAFNIGGNGDMIQHKVNGYLVESFDVEELNLGIKHILYNKNYKDLSNKARNEVLARFELSKVTKKYISEYEKCIREKNQ